MDYFIIFILVGVALVIVGGGMLGSFLLAPRNPGGVKNQPYECGEKTVGTSHIKYNIGYYLFAILFLVFDVEAAFLFPWAVVFQDVGIIGFFEILVFLFILFLGLIYAWRKGVLEWE